MAPSQITEPEHYTWRGGVEPLEFIASNRFGHLEGCIIKYLYRYPKKRNVLADLYKARFYLNRLIQREESSPPPA